MKKLTRMISVLAALTLMVSMAMAQGAGPGGKSGGKQPPAGARAGGPGGPGGRMMGGRMGGDIEKKVLAQLNLTADQKSKIEKLNKETEAKMKALMEKNKGKMDDEKARKTAMDAFRKISEDRKASLGKILSKAQLTKYESLMKAEREKMRKEMEKNRGTRPGGKGGKP